MRASTPGQGKAFLFPSLRYGGRLWPSSRPATATDLNLRVAQLRQSRPSGTEITTDRGLRSSDEPREKKEESFVNVTAETLHLTAGLAGPTA